MRISYATQRGKNLEVLISARGDWVSLPLITGCAAQYTAQIYEARRDGFRAQNRAKEVDSVRHSWFRPLMEPCQPDSNRDLSRVEWIATGTSAAILPDLRSVERQHDDG